MEGDGRGEGGLREREEDVRWLDVLVQHADRVGRGAGVGDLRDQLFTAIKDAFECGSISNGRELRDFVTDDIIGAACGSGMVGELLQYAVALVDWEGLYSELAEGFGLNANDEEAAQ